MVPMMLIEYAASYTEIFISLLLFDVFFERKYPRVIHIIFCIISSFAMMFMIQWFNSITLFSFATAVVWILAGSAFAMLFYRMRYLQALAVLMIFFSFIGILDFFTVSVIETFIGPEGIMLSIMTEHSVARSIFIVFVKLVLIVIYILLSLSGKHSLNFDSKTSVALIAAGVFFFFGFNYLITAAISSEAGEVRTAVIVAYMFMALFFVSWLAFIGYSGKYRKKQLESAVIEARLDVLEEDNMQLNYTYGSLAKVTHDFKNHLRTMQALASSESYDELRAYMSELNADVTNMHSVSYTGVDFVDAVINSKVAFAHEKGIDITVDASYPYDANIKHTDMCAVLVNLLDNAVEACERTEGDRRISLNISGINSMVVIKVENTSAPVDSLKTVKEDTVRHGYGIKIIESVAEKYHGTLETECKDGAFTAMVLLSGQGTDSNSGTK